MFLTFEENCRAARPALRGTALTERFKGYKTNGLRDHETKCFE
jgi:hypothetical protein